MTAEISFQYLMAIPGSNPIAAHGVIFHRWLPNGEMDAIPLDTKFEGTSLRIWFERPHTESELSSLRDPTEAESAVDGVLLDRYGKLQARTLHGVLIIDEVDQHIIELVKGDVRNDPGYISLAKRAVKAIYNGLSVFTSVLRHQYGQYWLRDFPVWDSRGESLGNYCTGLRMLCRFGTEDKAYCMTPTDRAHRHLV